MTTLSLELYDDLNERFKQNKLMLMVMIPATVIGLTFEISQLQSSLSHTKRLLIYFVVFPFLLISFCVLPLANYFKATRIIESYTFDSDTNFWHFNTLSKKSIEINESVTRREGTFKYFGHTYKAQLFSIGEKTYYFPVEKFV